MSIGRSHCVEPDCAEPPRAVNSAIRTASKNMARLCVKRLKDKVERSNIFMGWCSIFSLCVRVDQCAAELFARTKAPTWIWR